MKFKKLGMMRRVEFEIFILIKKIVEKVIP